jgi:iron complex outermembrane receptor protein
MVRPPVRRVVTAVHFSTLLPALILSILAAPGTAPADEAADGEPVVPAPESEVPAPQRADDGTLSVGEVMVTATRANRAVLDTAGNVTVITREEIDRSGVRNLPDLLRRQPGLFVTNHTSNLAGYTIDARGFNNGGGNGSNILVQIDGRRANEPDSDTPDWALIPLDQIESVEIVRGPVSALYGDNAVGGVINVRTRAVEGPPRAILRGRFGRYDSGGGSISAAGTSGPATAALFIEGTTTDGYRDQSAFSAENYQGSFQWNFADRVLVGARGGYHEDSREFPGALPAALAAVDRRAANPDNAGDHGSVESAFVHGWLEASLADGVLLKVQPFYRPREDDATFTSIAFGDATVGAEKWSAGVESQLQVDIPLGELPNRLVGGFEYIHDDRSSFSDSTDFTGTCTTPTVTTTTESQRDVYAFFIQDELQIHEQVLLSAGVRFDRAELDVAASISDPGCPDRERKQPDYSIWSPRASITWRPIPEVSLYGAYSRGFRLPSLDESSPLVFPGFVNLPNLAAQTSNGGEIGAKFRNKRFEAQVAFYLLMVEDEILFDPIFFDNFNLERVRHRGVETSFTLEILRWLQLYGNYTFDDIEIREADNPGLAGARMPITPRHRGTVGIFSPLPYQLEARANANFVGERLLANDFGQGGGTLAPLDFYATLDLLFAWRPNLGEHLGGALTFALRNVTNEKFDDFGARGGAGRFLYPAATRTWEVGLEVNVRL